LYSTEHSPTMPMWRGSYLRCIDIATGNEAWKLADWVNSLSIADGYAITLNLYDNQIYCIGKGPSETTVTATPGVGSAVTIQGTVMDQSVGKPGIPAISDADQEAWMEHVYEQQGMPQNAQGVPVTLYETDPNGNTYTIGTVTTDISGHFMTSWTPTLEGTYKITAAFDGTNAYYGSTAVTGIAVGPATAASPAITPTPPPTTVTPTPVQPTPTLNISPTASATTAPPPPTSQSPATTYIVIGIAIIVIVVAATALVLRRRK
jgi:hypothetical protein